MRSGNSKWWLGLLVALCLSTNVYAAGWSEPIEGSLLDWVFKQTAFPAATATRGFSLHSADPGDTCTNELAATLGYGRAQLDADINNSTHTNYEVQDDAGTTSRISNKLDITFPTASGGNWNGGSALQFYCVSDSTTVAAGNCLFCGGIAGGGVVILDGNTLRFTGSTTLGSPPGQMTFTVD
jgi:hypothetical protein